jgi:uncharacterized protein YndB with AHSA1/START domain
MIVLALVAAASAPPTIVAQERQIRVSVTVSGTPERLWPLWTTNEGVRSFFAPGSNIDLRVDGAYEIFFDPAAPSGGKGAEGMRLLAVEPNRRLAFTWNAPETMAYVRQQRTIVSVDFLPVGRDSTRVVLRQIGWGTGPEWDQAFAYFDNAWNGFVMPMFKYRVEHGPVTWSAVPTVSRIQATSMEHLTASKR